MTTKIEATEPDLWDMHFILNNMLRSQELVARTVLIRLQRKIRAERGLAA